MTQDPVGAGIWDVIYQPSVRIITALVFLYKKLYGFSDQAAIWELWLESCFQARERSPRSRPAGNTLGSRQL